MKHLAWIALILAFSANAEIELKISDMNYKWGDNADFPLKAYQIGYTHYFNDYGLKILGGRSDKRYNTVDNQYKDQTQQMKRFFVGNVHKRFNLTHGISWQLGVNYTEYQSCSDSHGCNADTGLGYGLAIQKNINDYAIKLSYDDLYAKQHKTLGKEITRSTAISFIMNL